MPPRWQVFHNAEPSVGFLGILWDECVTPSDDVLTVTTMCPTVCNKHSTE